MQFRNPIAYVMSLYIFFHIRFFEAVKIGFWAVPGKKIQDTGCAGILQIKDFEAGLWFFSRACIEAHEFIQRAKTYQARKYKYGSQNDQYQAKGAGYPIRKIKISHYGGQQYPDDPVGITHVLCHNAEF